MNVKVMVDFGTGPQERILAKYRAKRMAQAIRNGKPCTEYTGDVSSNEEGQVSDSDLTPESREELLRQFPAED